MRDFLGEPNFKLGKFSDFSSLLNKIQDIYNTSASNLEKISEIKNLISKIESMEKRPNDKTISLLRELNEETGYEITDETIYDCGTFQYLSYKDLHVFLMVADFDIHELHCDSKFENDKGKMVNEIVGYKWVDDLRFFYKSLQPIINECLNHYEEGYYEEMD